jgi:AraC-like DNA-binding protein
MDPLDALPRFAALGILLLIGLLLLRDAAASWAGRFAAALALSSAAYLVCSHAGLRTALGALQPVFEVVCIGVPALLWLTALAIFVDDFSPRPRHWAALLALEASGMATLWAPAFNQGFEYAHLVVEGALFGHALFVAWRDFGSDLVESRREFRRLFVGLVAGLGLVIAAVEIAYGAGRAPASLEQIAAVVVFVITFALAALALRIEPGRLFLPVEKPLAPAPAEPVATGVDAADNRTLRLILKVVEQDCLYRRSGLTISALAQAIRVPEHHVRRVINAGLGYRNFNAFLNRYRIEEVMQALGDPERARTPILTLAMDAGFGSLAPFNRAFKETVGATPSAVRRQKLGSAFVEEAAEPR